MADTEDSKSSAPDGACGFDSHLRHQIFKDLMPPLRKPKENERDKTRKTKVLAVDCVLVALPLNRSTPHRLKAGDSFGGRTLNLSKTGFQVHSDFELDPKSVIDVTVTLQKPDTNVTVRCEVAWAKRNAAVLYGRWSMGLRITESRPGDVEVLHLYYDSLH